MLMKIVNICRLEGVLSRCGGYRSCGLPSFLEKIDCNRSDCELCLDLCSEILIRTSDVVLFFFLIF
jgi:hypothetical protein